MEKPVPNQKMITLSEGLLMNVKKGLMTTNLEVLLENIPLEGLISGLSNDTAKKAFWINIYNAYFQILSVQKKITKPDIFRQKHLIIAQNALSLDDIEHGILRRYRWKLSMGYLPNLFTKTLIKRLSVEKIDFRIHFALNCGAKSCPPIAFYTYQKLENQLETAAFSFLSNETDIDEKNQIVHTSALLNWFRADFGGKKGIKTILSKYLEHDVSNFKIEFKKYDWTTDNHNFKE